MSNTYFKFKQFAIDQKQSAMKVGTDGVLLGAWANIGGSARALDIGTGTGVVALMLAQRSSDVMVDAVEIDEKSAVQAQKNFAKSPWANRLVAHCGSFQSFAQTQGAGSYNLIVSNPPYFIQSMKSPDALRTMTRHTDTLPFDELLAGIKSLLSPNGGFCGIFPYTEGNIFIAKATNYGLYCTRKLNVMSKPNHSTLRVLVQLEFEKKPVEEEMLTIHTADGDFTESYKALTKDFYLAF